MSITTVVVDAHTLTRYGLSALVAEQPDMEIAAETGSAVEAVQLVARLRPAVVTIDVGLPDGDGLQLARELRDRDTALGIVVLTAAGEDDVLFRALDTGASAFVQKTAPVAEVLGAIRHASVAATSFTATGLLDALSRRRATDTRYPLSPRERQVLGYLMEGLSTPAIAKALFVSPSTAKTYVARLYDKLGANNRAQALMTALRHGLMNQPIPA